MRQKHSISKCLFTRKYAFVVLNVDYYNFNQILYRIIDNILAFLSTQILDTNYLTFHTLEAFFLT